MIEWLCPGCERSERKKLCKSTFFYRSNLKRHAFWFVERLPLSNEITRSDSSSDCLFRTKSRALIRRNKRLWLIDWFSLSNRNEWLSLLEIKEMIDYRVSSTSLLTRFSICSICSSILSFYLLILSIFSFNFFSTRSLIQTCSFILFSTRSFSSTRSFIQLVHLLYFLLFDEKTWLLSWFWRWLSNFYLILKCFFHEDKFFFLYYLIILSATIYSFIYSICSLTLFSTVWWKDLIAILILKMNI